MSGTSTNPEPATPRNQVAEQGNDFDSNPEARALFAAIQEENRDLRAAYDAKAKAIEDGLSTLKARLEIISSDEGRSAVENLLDMSAQLQELTRQKEGEGSVLDRLTELELALQGPERREGPEQDIRAEAME
ncbi:MAG TPA: hypothetical protein VKA53_03085, partial [Thermoanaerobaculia bacterium]|nr:hypothetical protein [Thermoanaerobaculia bacterium]